MSHIEMKQSSAEELLNALTHGLGALLAVVGTIVMLIHTRNTGDVWSIWSAIIFGLSMILLYSASAAYHITKTPRIKSVLRVIDHCSIFILIVGSYAPFCLVLLRGISGFILFSANLLLGTLGIVLNAISLKRFRIFSMICYLLMGWSTIVLIKPMITLMSPAGLWLLLAGGLSYTVGVLFYSLKKIRFMHMVWHFFVLAGSILHFWCILRYVF